MTTDAPLPRYQFSETLPSLWAMARRGVSDPASVIPASILDELAVQLPGPGAPLVIADPALAREVLVNREAQFTRDRFMRRLMRRSWGKGLAAAEGEDWHRQRRAAAPAFRPQAVAENSAAFAAAAADQAERWPLAELVELSQMVAKVIADIVFSVLVDGQGIVDTAAIAQDMPAYIRRIARFGMADLLPLPERVIDRLRGIDRDPAVVRMRNVARALADSRGEDRQRHDMIALLAGAGPVEDNIRGLLPAAMDTTVAGTSWALYTLAMRPEWQARVAAEARSCGDDWTLDRLPLARRVIQEALRLYPPAPLVVRAAQKAMQIGGFDLRKGQLVAVSIYAMHRHRSHWDAPDNFDPDRFLSERSASRPAYLPFGTGPRMCIAAQFALAEMTVVVSRLLAVLELAPAGPDPQVILNVTTRSATGLNVVAKRRS